MAAIHPLTLPQITTKPGIGQAQNPALSINQTIDLTPLPLADIRSAYLHVPFCFHKCHYCDFYSIVDNRDRQAMFTTRLIAEIQAASAFFATPLETIFVGGGTPTLLAAPHWEKLLRAMREALPLAMDGEFTVEANPETVTEELATVLANGGVNRVSIGCQSFNPKHLKSLERWHDPANVQRSIEIFRNVGITNINLDLIFAVPGQTLDEWLSDLDQALALHPTHMSCYGLVYEPNTPLTMKMKAGVITPAEQELEAQMYRATIDRLAAAGFEQYEISNFAKINHVQSAVRDAFRCRHNLAYWHNRNWWPFGPSASGHVNGVRWKSVARLGEYLDHGPFPHITDFERVDDDARIGEEFMLGLRLIEGIDAANLARLLAAGERSASRRKAIDRFIKADLLCSDRNGLRLTGSGLMVADSILCELL